MAQLFEIHPDNPQRRLLRRACELLAQGGLLAVPTDSGYALVCHLDDKPAADSLRRIRGVDERHHLTLLCRDLSELASYARVDNRQFRLLKAVTPGPYTFILDASREVAPLTQAEDAEELISDGLSIEAVIDRLVQLFRERVPEEAWPAPKP